MRVIIVNILLSVVINAKQALTFFFVRKTDG